MSNEAGFVVLSSPLAARDYTPDGLPDRDVVILALGGPRTPTALVVDGYGNLQWIDSAGLQITDKAILDEIGSAR